MKNKLFLAIGLLSALVLSGCGGSNPSSSAPTTSADPASDTSTTSTTSTTSADTSTVTPIIDWPADVKAIMVEVLGEALPMIPNATSDWEFFGLTEEEQELIENGYNFWYSDYSTETKAADYALAFAGTNFSISAEEDEDGPYYYFEKVVTQTETELTVGYGYVYDDSGSEDYDPSLTIEFNVSSTSYITDWSSDDKALMNEHIHEVLPFCQGFTDATTVEYDTDYNCITISDDQGEAFVSEYGKALVEGGFTYNEDSDVYWKASATQYKGYSAEVTVEISYFTFYGYEFFNIYAYFGMAVQTANSFPATELNTFLGESYSFADLTSVGFAAPVYWIMNDSYFSVNAAFTEDQLGKLLNSLVTTYYIVNEYVEEEEEEDYDLGDLGLLSRIHHRAPLETAVTYTFISLDGAIQGYFTYDPSGVIVLYVYAVDADSILESLDTFPSDLIAGLGEELPVVPAPEVDENVKYKLVQKTSRKVELLTVLADEYSLVTYADVLEPLGFTVTKEESSFIATSEKLNVTGELVPNFGELKIVYLTYSIPMEAVTVTAETSGLPTKYGTNEKVTVGDLELLFTDCAVYNKADGIQFKKGSGTIDNDKVVEKIQTITIKYSSKNTKGVLTISGGDDSSKLTIVTGTENDDHSFTYDLGGVDYFAIENLSGNAAYLEYVTFEF